IGKWKGLDRSSLGRNIAKTAICCSSPHRGQHFARQVVGDDLGDMRRHPVADMARAASEIQNPRRALSKDPSFQLIRARASGMFGAFQIGCSLRSELSTYQALVALPSHELTRSRAAGGQPPAWLVLQSNTSFTLVPHFYPGISANDFLCDRE